MLRRRFIEIVGLLGAGGAASVAMVARNAARSSAGERKITTYGVQGFTCITCALGLETLLRREKGVLAARADYPSATAVIEYDPTVISDSRLQTLIQDAGFHATKALG